MKSTQLASDGPALAGSGGLSDATARVARTLLQEGSATAGELAATLFLTPTAVRRHLDALIEMNLVSASDEPQFGPTRRRRRGRPAKYYCLTPSGRDAFESSYDDVAVAALQFLAGNYGSGAVGDFARARANGIAERYGAVAVPQSTPERLAVLVELLAADGYAPTVSEGPVGAQLCQHHCPVAHVAEHFPEFCEAERQAFAELLGVHTTRLSTIAAGGGVCTTVVPDSAPDAPASRAERSPE